MVSSALPTGRIVVFACPAAPLAEELDARLILISHQPAGRQSNGWLTCTAWIRPGGSVSLLVESNPNPTRIPSDVDAML